MVKRRRVGLLGGTFDPPHVGHLFAARAVAHDLGLDEVRFVVAGDPWQKSASRVSPAMDRLAMMRIAVDEVAGLVVSDIEVQRKGPSYTADTLETLGHAEPDVDWFFIVGSDAAAGLETWKRHEVVAELATMVVVARPPRIDARPPEGWPHVVVEAPLIDLSSTELRERIRTGRPVEWLVPAGVIAYADSHDLYGVGR